MAQNRLLADTSFFYALTDTTDKYHLQAVEFARKSRQGRVTPDVVLTEVTHLLQRHVGYHAVPIFLKAFTASQIELQAVTLDDLKRAYEIMTKYSDAKLDFVDCCIMALAERLNITQICTFDRRDFSIVRLIHCEALELLP